MKKPEQNKRTIGEIAQYAQLDTWTLAKMVAELTSENEKLLESNDQLIEMLRIALEESVK